MFVISVDSITVSHSCVTHNSFFSISRACRHDTFVYIMYYDYPDVNQPDQIYGAPDIQTGSKYRYPSD
jgi:hypothetical protein